MSAQEPESQSLSGEVESWSGISLLACGPPPARKPVSDEVLAARGLPPIAYVDNIFAPDGNAPAVLAIRRGEVGYHSVQSAGSADDMNRAAEVNEAQVLAMMTGSMFGWDVLGAHPWTWRQHLRQLPRGSTAKAQPAAAQPAATDHSTNERKEFTP